MSTLNELIASYNVLATAAGLPARKGFDNKAKAQEAIDALTAKSVVEVAPVEVAPVEVAPVEVAPVEVKTVKARRNPKLAAIREKGPRGWIFGPKWLSSVKTATGIATQMQNLPKLLDFAKSMGLQDFQGMSQGDIVKTLSAKL